MIKNFVTLIILGLTAYQLHAGDHLALSEKVSRADYILEVQLEFSRPIPRDWKNKRYDPTGWAFPDILVRHAKREAVLLRVLKGQDDSFSARVPGDFFVMSMPSPCWWEAHRRKRIRTLVFLSRLSSEKTSDVVGVEHEGGMYTDLNPDYDQLVEAIVEAVAWPEEGMRAVPAAMLWLRQKEIVRSGTNRYMLHLAARFIEERAGERILAEIWGERGTVRRSEAEARAKLPDRSFCLP